MTINNIEEKIKQLVNEDLDKEAFIYDFLLAYGLPKASITRLRKGNLNLSKNESEILWKKKLLFREIESDNLLSTIQELKSDSRVNAQSPRFIIITNYKQFVAFDTKTKDSLDIKFEEIKTHFDFFLPWAGMEKAQYQAENPADVKAAERMAKLFDQIKKDNPSKEDIKVHELNVFLIRLLFCFFAEDTEIFEQGIFTNLISSHTQSDGSDLASYFDRLFDVLNTSVKEREKLPAYLSQFPYVNGGLFKDKIKIPEFSTKSRQLILESGQLNWSQINPDIFGSMMQAVVDSEQRSGLGMHYTSVPNIMKVIEPLFLDELKEEFEKSKGKQKQLIALRRRIANIKIFDPACGSGNFLIISYKELRRLEIEIIRELGQFAFSGIHLSNFYGIEIDDFACEVAKLSLWLAEHQMNVEFKERFGKTSPTLPLKEAGNIVNGNATRLDWEEVCPKGEDDEIYVLGNPPYVGSSMQNKEQKQELADVFKSITNSYKNLDYISIWFYKGGQYVSETKNCKLAFVSTNSISQGEQVALLWPYILDKSEIFFAHQSFKWQNNAKYNAGVTVVIIGLASKDYIGRKYIIKDGISSDAKEINGYLVNAPIIFVPRTPDVISEIPDMVYGNKSTDGGFLIFNESEANDYINSYPEAKEFIKPLVGSSELIRGINRYCLWIDDKRLDRSMNIRFIKERLEKVSAWRLTSKAESTRKFAKYPNRFKQITHRDSNTIVIPRVSSERRQYIPFGFVDENTIVLDSAQAIYNPEPFIFSIISSRMHMTWVRAVAGRLETRIRYSSTLCYNTFPFPQITENKKKELTENVYRILEEREKHSEKTLAQLYDPEKMPDGLKEAHRLNDLAVERCYRSKPFESDEERLEYLFKMYEEIVG